MSRAAGSPTPRASVNGAAASRAERRTRRRTGGRRAARRRFRRRRARAADHRQRRLAARAVRRHGASVQGDQRLRPGDDLSLRRGGPRRGVRRDPQARTRSLSRQPLPRLRHPADRPPALCAQPRADSRRRAIRAGAAGAAAVAGDGAGPRHVAVLPAQRLADPRPVSEEHGGVGDARRLVDGRRASCGG